MSMYPSDDILLARGKYSTLAKERKEQIVRVQGICATLMTAAHNILQDCQAKPPVNLAALESAAKCVENAISARDRISVLVAEMKTLEPLAWGGSSTTGGVT